MLVLKRDKDVIKELVAQRWGYVPHLEFCGGQKRTIFLHYMTTFIVQHAMDCKRGGFV